MLSNQPEESKPSTSDNAVTATATPTTSTTSPTTELAKKPTRKPPKLDNVELLRRFIYTSDYNGQFITGDNDNYLKTRDHQQIIEWIKQSHQEFIETILLINNEDLIIIQRQNIFYILAMILTTDDNLLDNRNDENIKKDIRDTVLKCCKDDDIFDFIRYFTILKRGDKKTPKMSKPLRKTILQFYSQKTPMELAKCVTNYHSKHGWSHKDLIKLSHFKAENSLSAQIIKYVLFGFDKIKDDDNPEFKDILNHIRLSHELRTTEDVNRTVTLIKELHASIGQINSKFNKNEQIWSVLLSEMSPKEVLRFLPKFYRSGWLRPSSTVLNGVLACLTDETRIKNSNIHPIEVFIYLKIFEKGGKQVDPQFVTYLKKNEEFSEERIKRIITPIEPRCPPVFHNINKCLHLSYKNVRPIVKRFLITLDVCKTINGCFQNRGIPPIEAAYSIIRFFQKTEGNNVTLAVFCDDRINLVEFPKCYSFHEAIEKLQKFKSNYIVPHAPIEFAINKKKKFDVFINFQNTSWSSRVPKEMEGKLLSPSESLNKYCTKMNHPNTKLVRICLTSHKVVPFDNSKNILNIAGFTNDIPRTLEAFCRENFV